MSLKQFLLKKLNVFFMLTTLITVAICVLGSHFDPDARFGYRELMTPIFYAGCCVLPSLVTYSKRELTPRGWLLRVALQFMLTEGVILGIAFQSTAIDTSRPAVVLWLAASVLIIFVLVLLFSWLMNAAQAKQVNEELQEYQRLHGADIA